MERKKFTTESNFDMEKQTEQLPKKWEELTFADNFIFCKVLESDTELCRQVLELLLHIEIERLEVPVAEKTVLGTADSKSVRFDVYVKNSTTVFDIEMQTVIKPDLAKRARYYQGMIDMDGLPPGKVYGKLRDSYVIFICLTDPFDAGLPVYSFENLCIESPEIKLNDRAYKIFFNASACDKLTSAEEKAFFKFVRGISAESDLTKTLDEKVSRIKQSGAERRRYMTWEQTILEERELAREAGRTEGFEAGARNNAIENARNLLQETDLSPEKIALCCSVSLEEVLQLKEELVERQQ